MKQQVKSMIKPLIKPLIDKRVVHYHVAQGPSSVLLTFDDGPHPAITPQVLDLLDRYEARAVFFLIGERAEKEPDLVREIHSRGHYLGNHTYSHLNDFRGGTYGVGQYLEEIRRCQDLVHGLTGQVTTLFRPPRGELNHKSVWATLRSKHRIVHWSLAGGEWDMRKHETADAISEFVTAAVRPRDIVLFHDDNEKTPQALESLLQVAIDREFDLRHNSLVGTYQ